MTAFRDEFVTQLRQIDITANATFLDAQGRIRHHAVPTNPRLSEDEIRTIARVIFVDIMGVGALTRLRHLLIWSKSSQSSQSTVIVRAFNAAADDKAPSACREVFRAFAESETPTKSNAVFNSVLRFVALLELVNAR